MTDDVRLQVDGPIARLVLARAEKLNAITMSMLEALDAACDRIERSPGVRVVIVGSDHPRAFCSGADIAEWSPLSPEEMWRVWTRTGHRVLDRLAALPQPTLAALHGVALGGGLELALACDLRVATSDCQLGMPETRVGAIPGWGGTERLARLVGPGRAKYLILRAARIDAATALGWGLVEEVVDPASLDARVTEIAGEIASRAPGAVRLAKQLIDAGAGGPSAETLAAGLALSLDDGREGAAAFREKREPRFTGS
jgi:enoyl-CoA hydratase/carnithine racemase